jgi:hypothetical protein
MSERSRTKKVLLVVPKARAIREVVAVKQRKLNPRHLRIGTLDNNKANADVLLRFVVDRLKATLPVASVVNLKKTIVGMAAPPQFLDRLASETDFVIGAMAD